MVTDVVASRNMIRLAAAKLDAQAPNATSYCAMAKKFATDTCFDVANDAIQIFGGYGYTKEYPVERIMRDLRVHQILEGTNEIMRLIISRNVLAENGLDGFS
jgi:alkylation response protein AidB-like acyl-CoA dehydrogenase